MKHTIQKSEEPGNEKRGETLVKQFSFPEFEIWDQIVRPTYANSIQIPRFFTLTSIFAHNGRKKMHTSAILKPDWPQYYRRPVYTLVKSIANTIEYSGPLLTMLHHDVVVAILDMAMESEQPLTSPVSFSLRSLSDKMGIQVNGARTKVLSAAITHIGSAEFHIHQGPLLDGLLYLWNNRNDPKIIGEPALRKFIDEHLYMLGEIKPGSSLTIRLTNPHSVYNSDGLYTVEFSPWMVVLFLRDFRVRVTSNYYWQHEAPLTQRISEIVSSYGQSLYDWNMETWSRLLLSPVLQSIVEPRPDLEPHLLKEERAFVENSKNKDRTLVTDFYSSLYESLKEAEHMCEILPGWSMEFSAKERKKTRRFKTRNLIRPPASLRRLCNRFGIPIGSIDHRIVLLVYYIGYYNLGDMSIGMLPVFSKEKDPEKQMLAIEEGRKSIYRRWQRWREAIDRNIAAHQDKSHPGYCSWFDDYKGSPAIPHGQLEFLVVELWDHLDVRKRPDEFPAVTGDYAKDMPEWKAWLAGRIEHLCRVGVFPADVKVTPLESEGVSFEKKGVHVIEGHQEFIHTTFEMDNARRRLPAFMTGDNTDDGDAAEEVIEQVYGEKIHLRKNSDDHQNAAANPKQATANDMQPDLDF